SPDLTVVLPAAIRLLESCGRSLPAPRPVRISIVPCHSGRGKTSGCGIVRAECRPVAKPAAIRKVGHRENTHRTGPGLGRLPEGLPRPVHDRSVAGTRAYRR